MPLAPHDDSTQLLGDQSTMNRYTIQRHNAWLKRGLYIAAYPFALQTMRRPAQPKPQTPVRRNLMFNPVITTPSVQDPNQINPGDTSSHLNPTNSDQELRKRMQNVSLEVLDRSCPRLRPISIRHGGRVGAKVGMRTGSVVSVAAALVTCFYPPGALISGPIAILAPLAGAGFGSIVGILINAIRRFARRNMPALSFLADPTPPPINIANPLSAHQPTPQPSAKVEHSFGKMDHWHGKQLKEMQRHATHIPFHPQEHVPEINTEEGKPPSEVNTPSMMVD